MNHVYPRFRAYGILFNGIFPFSSPNPRRFGIAVLYLLNSCYVDSTHHCKISDAKGFLEGMDLALAFLMIIAPREPTDARGSR